MIKFACLLLCLFFAGCAATTTHVMTGEARPPTDPASVRLYFSPPAHYKEIATITADSKGQLHVTAQGRVDGALKQLKEEAAKLGANGILLSSAGESAGGSPSAPAAPPFNGTAGVDAPAAEMVGSATGTAIWVDPAK
jgi:hypothetical protein